MTRRADARLDYHYGVGASRETPGRKLALQTHLAGVLAEEAIRTGAVADMGIDKLYDTVLAATMCERTAERVAKARRAQMMEQAGKGA